MVTILTLRFHATQFIYISSLLQYCQLLRHTVSVTLPTHTHSSDVGRRGFVHSASAATANDVRVGVANLLVITDVTDGNPLMLNLV